MSEMHNICGYEVAIINANAVVHLSKATYPLFLKHYHTERGHNS